MIKVLVADENVDLVNNCCQYLSYSDNSIQTLSATNGIDTLDKYNKMKADILILNSHFSDIKSTEIVDRLSATICERKNNNIILTVNSDKEQLDFLNTAKIYKFFKLPLDFKEVSNTIEQIKLENQYDDLDEHYLNKLLFSMKIVVGSLQTQILKDAIMECYKYPYLLDNFDSLTALLSCKYNDLSSVSIRSAIRTAIMPVNKYKKGMQSHKVVKMFDSSKSISPKMFLEVIVSYIHAHGDLDSIKKETNSLN